VISPGSGRSGAAWFRARCGWCILSSYSRRTLIGGRWFQIKVRSSSSCQAKTASPCPYDTGARYCWRRGEGWLVRRVHCDSDPVDALEQAPRVTGAGHGRQPGRVLRRIRRAGGRPGGDPQFPPPVRASARVHPRGDRRVPAGRESREFDNLITPGAGVSDWQTTRRPVRLLMSTRFPIAYDARGRKALRHNTAATCPVPGRRPRAAQAHRHRSVDEY
jgi:hypothetical protein